MLGQDAPSGAAITLQSMQKAGCVDRYGVEPCRLSAQHARSDSTAVRDDRHDPYEPRPRGVRQGALQAAQWVHENTGRLRSGTYRALGSGFGPARGKPK